MATYNDDKDIKTMREDIANRKWRLEIVRTVGTVASVALAGVGFFFLPPGMGQIAAVAAGGATTLLVPLITTKEIARLKVDEEYLESRMQGGNWGKGNWENYRREVAEHGYAGPQAAFSQGALPPGAPNRFQSRS